MTRTGHIALAGLPNVGKSSLLNRLVGEHLAIVSPRAQTTRIPVVGLRTEGDTQYVFHDLPGLLQPSYLLQEGMRLLALEALPQMDLILHLHPASDAPAPPLSELVGPDLPNGTPIITLYTKADLIAGRDGGSGGEALLNPEILVRGSRPSLPSPILVSALTGTGIDEVLHQVRALLPERPFEYDADDIGTQPLRFFVTEYLREGAFELLDDELPYAVTAEVEEFREDAQPVYIRVTLFVERESQKGILIGRNGQTLKQLGSHARGRLEALLGTQVFLDTWVKVLPKWRRSPAALARFGFPVPQKGQA